MHFALLYGCITVRLVRSAICSAFLFTIVIIVSALLDSTSILPILPAPFRSFFIHTDFLYDGAPHRLVGRFFFFFPLFLSLLSFQLRIQIARAFALKCELRSSRSKIMCERATRARRCARYLSYCLCYVCTLRTYVRLLFSFLKKINKK